MPQPALRSGLVTSLAHSYSCVSASAISALFRSEDFVEGPMAFAQKRTPNWKGK